MATSPIIRIQALGFPWTTLDPFLFCVYHDDAYLPANAQLVPAASLAGRELGQDFSRQDGWSMYHGNMVPGFPAHPYRGFETVTIVRKGLIDHADSLGAAARFGGGDVQWLTAGQGVVHPEMFPLLNTGESNPLELFQIWLNLPASHKMSAPHFTMLWPQNLPHRVILDAQGGQTEVTLIAGRLSACDTVAEAVALAPPPDSWAAQGDADVAIWTLCLAPGASWTLPAAASATTRRSLYFFTGSAVAIAGQDLNQHAAIELRGDVSLEIRNHDPFEPAEFLLLQGCPIGEPVAQYGPFVMNTRAEISQAMVDYQRTQFAAWPWADDAPVHGHDPARFARHPDGREERPAPIDPAATIDFL
jgi:redox-sensitive bicupin YhaK (pirin superfamily)